MAWEGAIPTSPEVGTPTDLQLGHNLPEPPETPLNYGVEFDHFHGMHIKVNLMS